MNVGVEEIKFDERGLVPAIVQDADSQEVLTLAYMNEESLRRTLETRETWFWSRSRSTLWHKGETSGHTQRVVNVLADCDLDTLVVRVKPAGPACHTGARTCLHNELLAPATRAAADVDAADGSSFGTTISRLFSVIESRKREMPEGSYTSYLFEKGLDKILKKVGEEASETIIAAKNDEAGRLADEISDLIYHLMVLMVERGLTLDDVRNELDNRGAQRGAK